MVVRRSLMLSFLALFAVPLVAAPSTPSKPCLTVADYVAVRAAIESGNDDGTVFQAFLDKLPTVTLMQSGGQHRYYLFEGDLLLSRDEVRYALGHSTGGHTEEGPEKLGRELIVNVDVANRPLIWPIGHRALTYDIDLKSFPNDFPKAVRDQMVNNIERAAGEWVAACPGCGLSITHLVAHDASPHEGDATFIVSYANATDETIASSFFPSDPPEKHHLYVFPAYLSTSYDKVGVFRHEIGHILGYRHEHIRPEAGCQNETGAWKPLSDYDSKSVMHYYCGNGGTLALALTAMDRTNHHALYRGGL